MIKLLFRPKTGLDWGLNSGPYLILWPFLVSWSIPPLIPVRAWPSWELGCWSERELRRASHPSEGRLEGRGLLGWLRGRAKAPWTWAWRPLRRPGR